jgi:glycosyltransferase involved in cell wall biosynthesis
VSESKLTALTPIRVVAADALITTSQAVAQLVVGITPQVVHPSVHIPRANGGGLLPQGTRLETVLGVACRLVSIKGIIYLIRALAVLQAEFPELRLEIAGTGSERPIIESEAETLGLKDRVAFLGWQADLAPVLARWDIFVQPSLEEGFGIAALEAMAAGLPVVATAVGGISELVKAGQTGWLVPPGDPEALAERLRALLLDVEQRRRMGEAGRKRAMENFSVERMVAEISNIYDELLQRRNPQ